LSVWSLEIPQPNPKKYHSFYKEQIQT